MAVSLVSDQSEKTRVRQHICIRSDAIALPLHLNIYKGETSVQELPWNTYYGWRSKTGEIIFYSGPRFHCRLARRTTRRRREACAHRVPQDPVAWYLVGASLASKATHQSNPTNEYEEVGISDRSYPFFLGSYEVA